MDGNRSMELVFTDCAKAIDEATPPEAGPGNPFAALLNMFKSS